MKPKGLVNKRITKTCPECNKQMPTACKSCSCGFVFKRNNQQCITPPTELDNLTRRRTGRVKKEPNYFNTMEYDHHFKRRRIPSTAEDVVKKKKGKQKSQLAKVKAEKAKMMNSTPVASVSGETSQQKEEKPQKEEDLHATISTEKALQYAIILAEINRKFLGQSFSPT